MFYLVKGCIIRLRTVAIEVVEICRKPVDNDTKR